MWITASNYAKSMKKKDWNVPAGCRGMRIK